MKKLIFVVIFCIVLTLNVTIDIGSPTSIAKTITAPIPTAEKIPYIEQIQRMRFPDNIGFWNFVDFIKYQNPRIKHANAKRIAEVIFLHSEEYDINPLITLSVVRVESTYNWLAKGEAGERGLMQVYPDIWVHDKSNPENLLNAGIIKKERDLFYIGKNVESGTYILSKKRDQCNRWIAKGRLKKVGYNTIDECMIRRYNGVRNRKYYQKVTAVMGDYYLFSKDRETLANL